MVNWTADKDQEVRNFLHFPNTHVDPTKLFVGIIDFLDVKMGQALLKHLADRVGEGEPSEPSRVTPTCTLPRRN